MRHKITFKANGVEETHAVDPNVTLLTFLREELDLTGAKEGCNEGECGACMVLLNGRPMNACLMLAVELDGQEVTTIEGLGDSAKLHPIQSSFLAHNATQCGFCAPGMIITSLGLLNEKPQPTEADIKDALAGNLCRCTGYTQIVAAIGDASKQLGKAKKAQARAEAKASGRSA